MASVGLLRLISSEEHVHRTQTVERRQVPRVTMRRAITYGVLRKGQLMLAGKDSSGSLMDISNAGMCISTPHRLEKRMVLKVRVPIKEDLPVAPTLVQVMWVMNDAKRRGFRIGVRFII
jgi:c-di-GMP-binding flagellar brake protein YcgR